MWTAPLQPFVLPVRLRRFEELYKSKVVSNPSASAVSAGAAERIRDELRVTIGVAKDALVTALRGPTVRFCEVPIPEGLPPVVGIYSGQLYHLIKSARPSTEIRSEEELKIPLMKAILGESNLRVLDYKGRKYYTAPLEAWSAALGITPTVTSV